MVWISIAILLLVLVGIYSLQRIRHEYRTRDTFTARTVLAVWVLYGLHAALTVFAAWQSVWGLPISVPLSRVFGGPLLLLGLALVIAAIIEFRSFRRMSGMLSNKLVASGVYRWSRNPQNVGWAVVYVGVALLGRSGLAFLLTGLFWVSFLIYLPLEEEHLERIFGQEYREYGSKTARFWGRPRTP